MLLHFPRVARIPLGPRLPRTERPCGHCLGAARQPRSAGACVVPGPAGDRDNLIKRPALLAFFLALTYALAYLVVTSALDRIDSSLPHTTQASPFRGHSYVRHGERFAGSSSESSRGWRPVRVDAIV
jgi:hypothetical protein